MVQSFIEKLSRYYRHWLPTQSYLVQEPLLNAARIQELALYAQSLHTSLFEFHRYAAHPLIGETVSFYRGRGFEFEENRAYQAGDESRLINWRLYARAGELYSKVFSEDRRPQVFLLMDRRATMRFATRGQLKAALAAEIAACYIFQAQQQALAVGGLILNQTADWFTPAMAEVSVQNFLQSLAAACPPLDFEQDQPDLAESLQLLNHRLPAGSFVLLISDFADLDPDIDTPLLYQLAAQHTVQAIQILDPVEQHLPTHGDFLIEDMAAMQPLHIDGRDGVQQTLYTQAFEQRQSKLCDCFNSCGIAFRTCTTQDDVKTCLQHSDASTSAN